MLNVIILAAGKGNRMHSAQPKSLQYLGGITFLDRILSCARALSPDRIIIVVGHGGNQIRLRYKKFSDIFFADQYHQLGTGHAVKSALPMLKFGQFTTGRETSLVLYGDVPLVQIDSLKKLIYVRSDNGIALVTQTLCNPNGYGRIIRKNKEIIDIVEENDANETVKKISEVNTGILALPTAKLNNWLDKISINKNRNECYLTDIIKLAVSEGIRIDSISPNKDWEVYGVNTRLQQANLERIWQREQAYKLLDNGVTIIDPERFDLRGDISCGIDVIIDVGCIFEGEIKLGNNVKIGPHCFVKNAVLGDFTEIQAFSYLDGIKSGKSVKIGPYARVRPNTFFGDNVKIGNFVEIKNSEIGLQTKIGHMTYLGDAQVGKKVNIGAGTITCNFDGKNKYKTIIHDEAFIGADSQLIAPVTIGLKSTVGAGSTVTRDVPDNKLALSRTNQVIINLTEKKEPKNR